MHAFVNRFLTASFESQLQRAKTFAPDHEDNEHQSTWGSQAGFGNLANGIPTFAFPNVVNRFCRCTPTTENPARDHESTTLAFIYQGGIIVAVDSRATMGSYIDSGTVKKVIEINPYVLGTMAGTAGDCQYWETYLGMHARLHELRNGERLSVGAASKYLASLVYSYKGMGLGIGTIACGWDKTGPSVYSVSSDGSRLKGTVFSEGSGSTHAYGVLDQGYDFALTDEAAYDLARRAIYSAGHRDAYTGNRCNLYHIKEDGWHFIGNYDISTLHYDGPKGKGVKEGYGYEFRVAGRSSANPP